MASDIDSAGVYFLSVEVFEWRPRPLSKDEPAAAKDENAEAPSAAPRTRSDAAADGDH